MTHTACSDRRSIRAYFHQQTADIRMLLSMAPCFSVTALCTIAGVVSLVVAFNV